MTNLPSGWIQTKIDSIAEIQDKRRIPVNVKDREKRIAGKNQEDLYPYFGATGQVGWIDDYIFNGEYILLGEDGAPFNEPFKNKAYLVKGKFWVNNHAHILRAFGSNTFLCHYLNQIDYRQYVTGTTRLKLNQSSMRQIPVNIPPLPEQHRIVTKIEQLFTQLDKGIENLKKAQTQLKQYRQAVLKHAFEGKLTEKWRQENPPEPAEKLLKQIKAARDEHYKQQLKTWQTACEQAKAQGQKKPAKPRKPKELPPLTDAELAELPVIPKGWCYIRLLNICRDISDGDHSPPPKSKHGIPFITISNIKKNIIDFSKTFHVNEKYFEELKDIRKPQIGDILYTVTGSFGIPVLINFNQKFCFQRHIGIIRPYDVVRQKFLFYQLQSNSIFQQAKDVATGTAQKTVSLAGLRNLSVATCSAKEQKQITNLLHSRRYDEAPSKGALC